MSSETNSEGHKSAYLFVGNNTITIAVLLRNSINVNVDRTQRLLYRRTKMLIKYFTVLTEKRKPGHTGEVSLGYCGGNKIRYYPHYSKARCLYNS